LWCEEAQPDEGAGKVVVVCEEGQPASVRRGDGFVRTAPGTRGGETLRRAREDKRGTRRRGQRAGRASQEEALVPGGGGVCMRYVREKESEGIEFGCVCGARLG
jgi:hypothetical protein